MSLARSLVLGLALMAGLAHAEPRRLSLTLQTRDPKTGQAIVKTENVESTRVAVVIVDPWNFHWCMTACERVSAMVPRWNRALECARELGMPILWAPSDVVGMYSGYPQRERALGVPLLPVPKLRDMPPAKFTAPGGGCMCGPGIACAGNYGWDGMNPDLVLAVDDLIASSTEEVYALLKERGITHVIYMGLHTNMCLFGKPGALKYMVQAGLNCMLARDINDAITSYNPATGFTPDKGTQQTDEDLERAGVPTIHVVNEWRKAGVWNDDWIVETVRITPWGKPNRPYFFEPSVTVTLTAPWLTDVEIRYTRDGSEPSAAAPLYEKPLPLSETKSLRTAAFRAGKRVSVPTSAYFVRLPPRPAKPDVYLDDLKYVPDPYSQASGAAAACFWQPKIGKSYEGQPLRVRGKGYAKGLGFRAPSSVRYQLRPDYDRFVALAGIADNLLDHELGRNLAMHCSVVFRVFLDGQLAAESPVMRMSQEPWRFDVPIPPGSRFINLVCMDAGSRNVLDLGNWVEAGFVLEAVRAYVPKGPSKRFCHFCCDYNLVGGRLEDYFSRADPVAYAEYHRTLHADAALLLAVPTQGYTTYETDVGTKFRGMKGDWFGEAIRELHKRDISALAYISLGWDDKWLNDHPEYGGKLCYNSPYLDLVLNYSREILAKYPVDGLRYDGLTNHNIECRCNACKRFYAEIYGNAMPTQWDDWQQRERFRIATITRAVKRIHDVCKQVKPSVEIWHNGLNVGTSAPLDCFQYVDFSYVEYGHPFGLLFHFGATENEGMIVGKLENLGHENMRLCMALGGRGYTYIKSQHWNALPPTTDAEADPWRKKLGWTSGGARQNARSQEELNVLLAPFYEMIGNIRPYLEGARPVFPGVGIVFCEATRYRFPNFSRRDYEDVMRRITEAYLKRSAPLEFVASGRLLAQDLSRFRLLILPETSGLTAEDLAVLRSYVRGGGQLLVAGQSLCYDEEGHPLTDFALSAEMGVSLASKPLPKQHVQECGKGRIVYVASPYSTDDLVKAIDSMTPSWPVTVSGGVAGDNLAILVRQESRRRWILHLIGKGNYSAAIHRDFAAPTKIAEKYPAEGWTARLEKTDAGMRITVGGDAGNRLLVLE